MGLRLSFYNSVIFSRSASTFAEPRAAPRMICRLAASLLRSPSDARRPAAPLLSQILQPASNALGFSSFFFFFSASRTSRRRRRAQVASARLHTRANSLTRRPSEKPQRLKMPPTGEDAAPLLCFSLRAGVYLTPNTKRLCCAAAHGHPEGSRFISNIYFLQGSFTR